ncbi:hypothetical protein [Siphonobacter sp. SORGH_AS_0500]|uniref:hypothetical protein n=1 Tax=Siphonobacter sp. SORGH_AS_0500 TaxID=1864824 RepID=UPI002859C7D0|nr:hypothetical protein [Siphonobacter sp. SORGH_AS_0500]MDR6193347.1 hypothetical protein [Siphonobacter sp. SORGH_AS_0500]
MKKNLYYRSVFKRTSQLKDNLAAFFLAFCSWPRLLLEVFIRRNMGERYFSFSTALFITFVLCLIPPFFSLIFSKISPRFGFGFFVLSFGSWYLYLAAFIYMCLQRREEIKRLPSVFDFARFSLSTGHIHPRFRAFTWMGKTCDTRTIETILEPAFFFLIGFGLFMLSQYVGLLILWCSIFYALSYRAAYRQGDHFVMDKIDEYISNEELSRSFIEGRPVEETRGFPFYGRRPTDPEMRRQLASSFIVDDEVVDVS